VKQSKWSQATIDRLLAQTKSNANKSAVFSRFSREMGLTPNSVRNFYYCYIGNADKKKVRKFTKLEIQTLLRTIILGYSRGESVRSICLNYAKQDRAKMLRYQNKYRAILLNDKELIEQTIKDLETEGYIVKSPLHPVIARRAKPDEAIPSLMQQHGTLNNIIEMPLSPNFGNLTDQDITNLFMGLVRLVRKQGQSQIEKLKAEIERLKISQQSQSL